MSNTSTILRRPRLGLDLDSTLNTLDEAWCDWILKNHDPEFTLDKWKSWRIHQHTPAGPAVYDFLHIPGVFSKLGVREGAVEVTQRLAKHADLYVITASANPIAVPEKVEWLKKHFPHIPEKNHVFTESKHIVNVDVLVDDGAHNAEGFEGRFILFDQPWNRWASNLRRAVGWKGVAEVLHLK
jgi:5'-nucleotidase